MVAQKSVRVPHVARVQRVHAEHLRTRARRMTFTLRELLFGKPLSDRGEGDVAELDEELSACMHGVQDLFLTEVGEGEALQQAVLEWGRVSEHGASFQSIAAKRAALLFALHVFAEVRDHFRATDAELVADLEGRVLPLLMPRFVAELGQTPEALVVCTSLLVQLWSDVRPGADSRHAGAGAGAASGVPSCGP